MSDILEEILSEALEIDPTAYLIIGTAIACAIVVSQCPTISKKNAIWHNGTLTDDGAPYCAIESPYE